VEDAIIAGNDRLPDLPLKRERFSLFGIHPPRYTPDARGFRFGDGGTQFSPER